MKRILLIAAMNLICGSVLAKGFNIDPYLGAEVGIKGTGLRDLEVGEKANLNMLKGDVFAGIKFNEYVGLEVGTYITPTKNNNKIKTKINSYYGNIMGFAPLTSDLSLLGGLGYGHVKMRFKSDEFSFSIRGGAPRGVAGFQYKLIDDLHFRATGTYEKFSKLKKSGVSVGLGLVYSF